VPIERRQRIGDWLIPYDDATQDVIIKRTVADVLHATPGDDQDCMNSVCILRQRQAHVFPHPVYLVSTIQTKVYVVDRLDANDEPAHAVRYDLSERDSRLIREHDRYGAGEPGELRLRVPRQPKGTSHRAADSPSWTGGDGERWPRGPHTEEPRTRPVTSRSVGAKARYKVAVGALNDA
jgi:hypothetical protein